MDPISQISNNSREIPINDKSKYVIFSDLHIGGRGSRDDFKVNSEMFMFALLNYYYEKNYYLILNGDIEELQRVRFKTIYKRWSDLYEIFNKFNKRNRLIKLIGNHDIAINKLKLPEDYPQVENSIKLKYDKKTILVFHGHQFTSYKEANNIVLGLFLKSIAHPLGIKNFTRSINNSKKHKIEKKIYEFSTKNRLISIIGHTHRPLFESLSDIDFIKFTIENLILQYLKTDNTSQKKEIEKEISNWKKHLKTIYNPEYPTINSSLYNSELVIPSIFNSGYVIGNRGFTGIEIINGNIKLIHWANKNNKKTFFNYNKDKEKIIQGNNKNNYYKRILKQDTLNSVFTRINLLS